MSFLLLVFFIFLIIFFIFPYIGAKLIQMLFRGFLKGNSNGQSFSGEQKNNYSSYKRTSKKRKKKVIEENEGEYVDFEEIPDKQK